MVIRALGGGQRPQRSSQVIVPPVARVAKLARTYTRNSEWGKNREKRIESRARLAPG